MPFAERGGFPTHWTVRGNGSREALLIHCSLAHQGAWSGLADVLSPWLKMTAFDTPGHGRSADWDERGDYQAVTTAMAADLIQDKADLVGHSFGATVALRLAVEQPDKVRSLTLIEPVFFAVLQGQNRDGFSKHLDTYQSVLDALDRGDAELAASIFVENWGTGTPRRELPVRQRNYAADRIKQILNIQRQIYDDEAGLADRLQGLDLPVLILDGTASPAIMSSVCDVLQRRIKGATRNRIEGAGHMLPITHPSCVADRIAGFLQLGSIPE